MTNEIGTGDTLLRWESPALRRLDASDAQNNAGVDQDDYFHNGQVGFCQGPGGPFGGASCS